MSATAPREAASSQGYRVRNSTADRALDILLLFDDGKLTLSANDVAKHFGVARSTAYRYLQSLTSNGFLEESQTSSGFRLGPRVLELARLARKGIGLSELAKPIMRNLVERTGAPVLLTRRTGSAVVCLEREEAGQALRLSYERGQVLPINAGAAALALLAWASETDLDDLLLNPLTRFTEATYTDPSQLREHLTDIRRQGYAVSRGELDPDVLGIAAPICDTDGRIIAAISIAALSHRVPDTRIDQYAVPVLEAARQLADQCQLRGIH